MDGVHPSPGDPPMPPLSLPALPSGTPTAWEEAIYAFLVEKRRRLAVVPDTGRGRRDRAILLVLVLTGRRRAEVIGLRAGDLSLEGETVFYSYRGKGGKSGRRELPRPAHAAIQRTLADAGKELATMDPGESLWQAGAGLTG